MAFNTEDKKVSGILGKRVYLIPRNQRHYVWTNENWKDLLEDLEFTILSSKRPHFIGSVVLKREDNSDWGAGVEIYSIIDGQQRITTFLLLLSAIMCLFKERGEEASFEGLRSYLITTNLSNTAYCKLSSDSYPSLDIFIRNVCEWGKRFSSITHILHDSATITKHNKGLFDAVVFFYEALSKRNLEEIEKFRNSLLDTSVVEIIATSEEDAYTIFEILNARGQILEDSELIKNYIMRYYEPSNAVDVAKNRWENEIVQRLGSHVSQYIKHYVTHKYAKSGSMHNFNYGVLKDENGKHQVKELLEDLCKKAFYYSIVDDPRGGEDGNCSNCEYRVFSFMKSNRGILFRPIFLSLIHRNRTGELETSVYEAVLEFIRLYFICYNLLGRLTSNKLTDTVQMSAKLLEEHYSTETLKGFVNGLVRRLPTIEEFTKSFQSIGWSKINEYHRDTNQKRRAQIALETLETIETGIWYFGDYSIEHLNPDSENRNNANIGNLVLLEPEINDKNGSKSFEEKVDSYQDSRFKIARNIYHRYHVAPHSLNIITRSEAMAKKIFENIISQRDSLLSLM